MKVYHSEDICPRIFCFDKNCGSLLLSYINQANLCSEIRPFHLMINFYNFDSTKIIIQGKLLRKVSSMIRNQFQEARSKIQSMCISLLEHSLRMIDVKCNVLHQLQKTKSVFKAFFQMVSLKLESYQLQ